MPSRAERRGLAWLALSLLIWGGVERWRAGLPDAPLPIGPTQLLAALDRWPGPDWTAETPTGPIEVDALDSAGWVGLGLSPRQAAAALRYRTACGGFQNPETVARMRVLPEGWMQRHGHRLVFPKARQRRVPPAVHQSPLPDSPPLPRSPQPRPPSKVDLNLADSLELLSVKGVGPWAAHRILSARRKWGGVSRVEHLHWALRWDSLATALMPRFEASVGDVETRCPDSLDAEGWRALPGVGWKEGAILARYVALHGGADSVLRRCLGVRPEVLQSLPDYLRPCGSTPTIQSDLRGPTRTQ